MPREKIFPLVLIVLDICAAIAYIPTGNVRMVAYWFSAAVLTTAVTF